MQSEDADAGGSEASPLVGDHSADFPPEKRRRLFDKLTWRVVSLGTGIIFLFCVDRGNVGFAASDLCKDLHLTHSNYGTAVSLFSVGYILSQVVSNTMLRYFGAPVWLSLIVFTWGCIATGSAFIRSRFHFYLTRILLGIAEGGAFPGVFYYLSLFFPEAYIEEAYASVQAASYLGIPLSVPIAAGLLATDGIWGTTGWRNLLFVEGLMPVFFAFVLFFTLPKSIEDMSSLDQEEKQWLMRQHKTPETVPLSSVFKEIVEVVKILPFWCITVAWGATVAYYAVLANWLTLIIKDDLGDNDKDETKSETCGSRGSSVLPVILTAVPFALSGLLCLLIRTQTSRIRNRTVFTGIMFIICGGLLASWVWTRQVSFVFGFLSLSLAVTISCVPNMFSAGVAVTLLRPDLRAVGMGLGNSAANTASIALPMAVGTVIDDYGYSYAVLVVAGVMMAAAVFSFVVRDPLAAAKRSMLE